MHNISNLFYFGTTEISNFIKIRPMGAEMFRTDKKDGHHKPNSRFSQFCERASKLHIFHSFIITRNLVPTIQEEREN